MWDFMVFQCISCRCSGWTCWSVFDITQVTSEVTQLGSADRVLLGGYSQGQGPAVFCPFLSLRNHVETIENVIPIIPGNLGCFTSLPLDYHFETGLKQSTCWQADVSAWLLAWPCPLTWASSSPSGGCWWSKRSSLIIIKQTVSDLALPCSIVFVLNYFEIFFSWCLPIFQSSKLSFEGRTRFKYDSGAKRDDPELFLIDKMMIYTIYLAQLWTMDHVQPCALELPNIPGWTATLWTGKLLHRQKRLVELIATCLILAEDLNPCSSHNRKRMRFLDMFNPSWMNPYYLLLWSKLPFFFQSPRMLGHRWWEYGAACRR